MQHLSCVLHAAEPRPAGHWSPPLHSVLAAHSSARASLGLARAIRQNERRNERWTPGRREARPAQRAVAMIRSGASDGPPGAVPQRAERMRGVALSPFALVTFIWGRK